MSTNPSTVPSLRKAYEPYFPIGAAVFPGRLEHYETLLNEHYGSLTAENDMKPERIHPEPDKYDFTAADKIVDFAGQHGMKVRGHTLVWHNQTPKWFLEKSDGTLVSRETALATLKSHIDTVLGRYKGKVYGWDVVNEAIADGSDEPLRNSKWLQVVGPDFIAKAFEFAHAADSDAVLFYNDYNECNEQKRTHIYNLVKGLLEQGVPIHGIGMQGHWGIGGPSGDTIRETIEKYASLGVKVQITELDLSVFDFQDKRTDLRQPTPEMMEQQAERYGEIFSIFREYKDVITGVTLWGAADDWTWKDNFPVRGRKDWPLLFDEQLQPKSAFWRILP